MAHLFLLTRGVAMHRDQWRSQMLSQFWPFEIEVLKDEKDSTGKVIRKAGEKQKLLVQGVLRPFELWEYIVPEKCIPEALSGMRLLQFDKDGKAINDKHGACKINDDLNNRKQKFLLPILRKPLGAKALGKEQLQIVPTSRVMFTEGFGANLIGWRSDPTKEFETWNRKQEGL